MVDDEAAVRAAAGGLAEVGLAVGQARGGEDFRRAVLDEVAGVGQRVPEVEERMVDPLGSRLPGFRRGAGRDRRRKNRRHDRQHRAPSPHRRPGPGSTH